MKQKTKYHGEIEIQKHEIIHFPFGIPGFLNEKKFVVLQLNEESPFLILQSVQSEQLAFIMTIPFTFFPNYAFDIDENTIEQLHIEDEKDIHVFTILTVHEPFEKTTANLQAPVIINSKEKLGKQVILSNTHYKTKHLLTELVKEEV